MESYRLFQAIYKISEETFEYRLAVLIQSLELGDIIKQPVRTLSLGQRMRAELAGVFLYEPEILFLDEPTIGLDPTTKRTLWDLIRELNDNGHTIILCSHDMHEVDMLCDNVGIINTGNLVAYDTPQGLKDSLLESNKREMTEALSKISAENEVSTSTKEDVENLSLRKMSFLLKNQSDEIIDSIRKSDNVKSIEIAHNGRINLRIDNFDDMAVQKVLNDIIASGGIIKSITTEEPSLEDVFIKATAEVNEDDRA